MKIGVVGPGKWGQMVANVFRQYGGEIVYHVRDKSTEPVPGMGDLVSWEEFLRKAKAKMIDAIVCTAPPDVTRCVYEACLDLAIPSLLTKPLMLDEIGDHPPLVPTYVDYVRLWSPHYHRIKRESQQAKIAHVSVDFYGVGPYRSFPGLWDYGPHAASFLFDLLGDYEIDIRSVEKTERDGGDYRFVEGTWGGVPFDMAVGNASEEGTSKKLTIKTADGGEYIYEEVGQTVRCKMPRRTVVDDKPQALQLMIEDFIEDVGKKHVNLYMLWLSTKISRFLKQVEDKS